MTLSAGGNVQLWGDRQKSSPAATSWTVSTDGIWGSAGGTVYVEGIATGEGELTLESSWGDATCVTVLPVDVVGPGEIQLSDETTSPDGPPATASVTPYPVDAVVTWNISGPASLVEGDYPYHTATIHPSGTGGEVWIEASTSDPKNCRAEAVLYVCER